MCVYIYITMYIEFYNHIHIYIYVYMYIHAVVWYSKAYTVEVDDSVLDKFPTFGTSTRCGRVGGSLAS